MKKSPFRAFETAHEQSHLKDVLSESGIDVMLLHGKKQGTFTLQWIDKIPQVGILGVRSTTTPPFMAYFSFKCTSSTCKSSFLTPFLSFVCTFTYALYWTIPSGSGRSTFKNLYDMVFRFRMEPQSALFTRGFRV